jgi:hypothetical protein
VFLNDFCSAFFNAIIPNVAVLQLVNKLFVLRMAEDSLTLSQWVGMLTFYQEKVRAKTKKSRIATIV